eukprot:m.46482 g.46482  ORF g.46482 m.46482 type:complete len:73 (+) comp7269_c0_seq2:62-280(+)
MALPLVHLRNSQQHLPSLLPFYNFLFYLKHASSLGMSANPQLFSICEPIYLKVVHSFFFILCSLLHILTTFK